mmetsp:Transcript_43350/g.91051  ORF Transcript_43350/g.91051 Transcript_43350/m.91051 type:complete len:562 (-) Transcript_43350:361-2046(-)
MVSGSSCSSRSPWIRHCRGPPIAIRGGPSIIIGRLILGNILVLRLRRCRSFGGCCNMRRRLAIAGFQLLFGSLDGSNICSRWVVQYRGFSLFILAMFMYLLHTTHGCFVAQVRVVVIVCTSLSSYVTGRPLRHWFVIATTHAAAATHVPVVLAPMRLILAIPCAQLIDQMPLPSPILGHQFAQQPDLLGLVLPQQSAHGMFVKFVRVPECRLLPCHARVGYKSLSVRGDQLSQFRVLSIQVVFVGGVVLSCLYGIFMPRPFDQERGTAKGFHHGDISSVIDTVIIFKFLEWKGNARGYGRFLFVHLMIDYRFIRILILIMVVLLVLVVRHAGCGLGGRIWSCHLIIGWLELVGRWIRPVMKGVFCHLHVIIMWCKVHDIILVLRFGRLSQKRLVHLILALAFHFTPMTCCVEVMMILAHRFLRQFLLLFHFIHDLFGFQRLRAIILCSGIGILILHQLLVHFMTSMMVSISSHGISVIILLFIGGIRFIVHSEILIVIIPAVFTPRRLVLVALASIAAHFTRIPTHHRSAECIDEEVQKSRRFHRIILPSGIIAIISIASV